MESRGVILLADDEESVRLLLSTLLERDSYTVLRANDGAHALEISRAYPEKIDALITDYQMPHLDGLELAKMVSRERPGIRVMMMSGRMSNPAGIQESGFPMVAKPFTITSFLSILRQCLEGAPPRN
jgi:DNA-binding NtrC family response regulator